MSNKIIFIDKFLRSFMTKIFSFIFNSVWSRDAEYLLYDPGIETSYNFRRASGVAGFGGRCGLQHKISEVEALLSNAVSAVSVFYSKPRTDLWYICKEACMVSFPLDVLKSDLHGFVEEFYKKVETL